MGRCAANDDATMVRQHKRQAKKVQQKMMTLLETLDVDGDGYVGLEEWMNIASHKEVRLWLSAMGINTDDLGTVFTLLDEDRDGQITFEELSRRIPRIRG